LQSLRHTGSARFSELMKPTGLLSDVFKFHLQKLVQLGYVLKTETDAYALTPGGKEFANNLDDVRPQIQKQPKLSVFVVAREPGQAEGEPRYLLQQRRRHPYFGFWGSISGPVRWGEPIEDAARRELGKQTGLAAEMAVRTFYRARDLSRESGAVLEDKLFAVVEAHDVTGELSNAWEHGANASLPLT
jgi:ADP-ribose pyrophosphatase YjhB (NUDIX family)/predicted transcriptional regulator